jgi:nicotinate-nucleotide adenylyltransferase
MRVALFGGSFNPPHVGHVMAITYVLATEAIDSVVVVPVFEHALGKPLVSFEHRLRLAELAFSWLPRVSVSALEAELGAPSRTLRTIEALAARNPDWRLRLMVGSDILVELDQWHAFDRIKQLAPPLVMARAGQPPPAKHGHLPPQAHAPRPAAAQQAVGAVQVLPEVSSTHVRTLLVNRGTQAAASELRALVPRSVLEYVDEHGLYRSAPGAAESSS